MLGMLSWESKMAHIELGTENLTDENVTAYIDAGLKALHDHVNGSPNQESLLRNRRYYNSMGFRVLQVTPGFSHEMPLLGRDRLVDKLGHISFRRQVPPIIS